MTKDYKNLAKVAKFHQFIHFVQKIQSIGQYFEGIFSIW